MLRRFYINNYRCLENFELPISGQPSVLLIGKNGTGKTTISYALEILQKVALGTNRVRSLVTRDDFTRGRKDIPLRIEIEVELASKIYEYVLAFELPEDFKELRVREEKFTVDGNPVYHREVAQVNLVRTSQNKEASFLIDWHLVALPIIIQEQSTTDPLFIFKQWLSQMLILRPIPPLIGGESEPEKETRHPVPEVTNFGAWWSGLLAYAPAAYTRISGYLAQVMPDLKDIKNRVVGPNYKSLEIQFSNELGNLTLPFKKLSDGEKCFMICALVLAACETQEGLFCFWDEPDNFLALDEVGHFVIALRSAFQKSNGQFVTTSHHPEAIRHFSMENTLLLYRKSHLEPTLVRHLIDLQKQNKISGDLVNALIRGDVEP